MKVLAPLELFQKNSPRKVLQLQMFCYKHVYFLQVFWENTKKQEKIAKFGIILHKTPKI